MQRLQRSRNTRVLGGVVAGLADYLGMDVAAMRLIFVLMGVMVPNIVLAYLLAWIIIPEESPGVAAPKEDAPSENSRARTADEIAGEKVPEPQGEASVKSDNDLGQHVRRREWLGFGLIALGGVLLARQFIPRHIWRLPMNLLRTWWPLSIVFLGLALVLGTVRGR